MRSAATVAIALLTTVSSAPALDCFDVADVIQPQGSTAIDQEHPTELHVVGDAAYSIGEDSAFIAVYDLTDPAQPHELASLPLPAIPTGLAASGDWLLVTVPGLGLVRYDLADPFAPAADDTLDLDLPLLAVDLDGDLAAVSASSLVRTIAFDQPYGMIARGSYGVPSVVNDVAVDGDRLYLATHAHGLLVVDATNPDILLPAGAAGFPGVADRVDAAQGLAVLTGLFSGGLGFTASAYDVAGGTSPEILATIDIGRGYYYNVEPTVTGPDRVTIASRGLGIYDLAVAPLEFEQIGFLPGKHADLHQDGSRAVILSESELAVGLPGVLPPAPSWVTGAGMVSLEDDDYIFGAERTRLNVVQVDAPFGPERIGAGIFPIGYVDRLSIALSGYAVYVGSANERFEIVDVYNLRIPDYLSYRSLPADPTGLIADAGVLYVIMQGIGIATYDLADQYDPQPIATSALEIGAYRGAVKLGDQLLLGTETFGVDVFDVSDPTDISFVEKLTGRNYVSDLALAGDRLLVTDRVQTTQVWQADQDTGGWSLLGTLPASRVLDASVGGDVAYLRHEFGDVHMFDLRSDGLPELVGVLPTSFVENGGLVAGDDWVSVLWGPEHRIYPAPCLLETTAAPEVSTASGVALAAAPNPFNPRTRISFTLDRPGEVRLRVFDLRGRLVDTLIEAPLAAGRHHADWRGTDDTGRPAPSGIYHARLTAAGATVSRKLTLLK